MFGAFLVLGAPAAHGQSSDTGSVGASTGAATSSGPGPTAGGAPPTVGGSAINVGGALHAPLRFNASLALTESYSDNINLAARGNERSDLVTTVSPALRVGRAGPWVNLDATYSPQFLYYARGTSGSYIRNYLNATALATIIQNVLTFDAQSSITQQNVSPFGTQAAGTINGSANSTETRSFSLGPTLRSRFGNDLSYTAGYRYASTTYTGNYNASHTSLLNASFESGTSFRNLGYNATVSRQDQSFGGAGTIVQESFSNGLTYVVSPTVRARANAGYDRNRYPTTGSEEVKGLSYSGGVFWNPSRHTTVTALLGRRYFGPTANVSISEQQPRTSFSLSFTRDQTTNSASGLSLVQNPAYASIDAALQAQLPDPIQRQQAVQAILAANGLATSPYGVGNFVSAQLYVQKSLQASVGLLGRLSTIVFNAYRTEQQQLSNVQSTFDAFSTASKFRQTGVSTTLSQKLGPRTTASASLSKTRSVALAGTGDSRSRSAQVTLNRQLGNRTSGSLSLRNTVQQATGGNAAGNFYSGNYRENQILGSLNVNF